MKTLLVTVSETSVVRNVIRTDFLPRVLGAGSRIVLITPSGIVEECKKEFGERGVIVESIDAPSIGLYESILAFLARNGFRSGTNRIMQHRAYVNGESRIPVWAKEAIGAFISSLPLMRTVLRMLELRIHPSARVTNLFEKYKPDLVFSTILVNAAMDIPIMREAKRRSVRVVGMVRGWDNLTTYGILRVLPDRYFAHNEFLKEQAIGRHGMRKDSVDVVGTPDFDKYARSEFNLAREEFCAELGIDPAKKIILYAAIGDFLFPEEGKVAAVFERLIEKGDIPQNTVVVFRAHPAFTSPLEGMKNMQHVVPDRAADYRTEDLQQWDMKTRSTVRLINSIRHASAVVSPGSTMLIESALCDRPTIALAFDEEPRKWFSVARWSDTATHVVDLLKTGGARAAWSERELVVLTNGYITHDDKDREKRMRLVERFVGPNRGHAAATLAARIVGELGRVGTAAKAR